MKKFLVALFVAVLVMLVPSNSLAEPSDGYVPYTGQPRATMGVRFINGHSCSIIGFALVGSTTGVAEHFFTLDINEVVRLEIKCGSEYFIHAFAVSETGYMSESVRLVQFDCTRVKVDGNEHGDAEWIFINSKEQCNEPEGKDFS